MMAVAGAWSAVQEARRRQDRKRLRQQVSFVLDWPLHYVVLNGGFRQWRTHNHFRNDLRGDSWAVCELGHHFVGRYLDSLGVASLASGVGGSPSLSRILLL